jgi:hypothetical protein
MLSKYTPDLILQVAQLIVQALAPGVIPHNATDLRMLCEKVLSEGAQA